MIQPSETIPYAGPIPPPSNLHISIADFVLREITFEWTPFAPFCPTIHYNILSSNCGSCPTTTTNTTVTCTDVPTDGSMCTFAVQTEVCGVTGNFSDPLTVVVDKESMVHEQMGECSLLLV